MGVPRFPVNEIQSVDLAVPDVRLAERFYINAWGLEPAEQRGDSVYLRASGDDPYVLGLHAGGVAAIMRITFGVAKGVDLAGLGRVVEQAGGSVLRAPAANTGLEGGTSMVVQSPEGFVLRFVAGGQKRTDGGPRRAHSLRLSHVNLNCTRLEASREFFEKALGFEMTDRSAAMAFLRCNQDHHAVVLADSGVDGLNHVAFLMPEFDSVMRASGRMIDHGYPIGWGVGRHGPGDNIFAYFTDPFGVVIEHTSDVLQVDDAYVPRGPADWKWPPGRTDQWGIAPPKSERLKQAQLAVRFAPGEIQG